MNKLLTFLLISLVSAQIVFCQNEAEATYKEMFLDGEFFLSQEEYVDALSFYLKLYRRGLENNASVNYRLGICYLNIPGQKALSVPHLEKASEKADNTYTEGVFKQDKAPLDVFIFLGNAYRVNNRLEEAIKTYEKYLSLNVDKKESEINYANHQIIACKTAMEMQKTPVEIQFVNEGNLINSASSNYFPVISGDGNSLAYMNELPFYDAIYYTVKKNGIWDRPRNITPEIQSDGDLYTRSISFDGKTLLLSKEGDFNSDIWISHLESNGKWTVAQPISKNINTKFWESHASLSPDGKRLYFASNRKGSIGQMDIYYSDLSSGNEWSEPKNLGDVINTNLNEDSPVISPDGKKLYFSSQGHICMGGYDIFVSELDEKGSWSNPRNLGYPLNTPDDEIFYYPSPDNNVGYIALLADNGYGKEDIYSVNFSDSKDKILAEEKESVEITEKEIELEEVKEEVVIEEKIIAKTETSPVIDSVKKSEPDKKTEIVKEPELKQVEEKIKTLQVQPILFAFNSVNLTNEAMKGLDEIALVMAEFSELSIELNGYTDSKGSDEINQKISKLRSESVREYLIRKEIGQSRIKINAFGNTNYVSINNNPDGSDNQEGRKYNRRVEIKLANLDDMIHIIESNPVPEHLKFKK